MQTVKEEMAMAAAPHMGFMRIPGYRPAAIGMRRTL